MKSRREIITRLYGEIGGAKRRLSPLRVAACMALERNTLPSRANLKAEMVAFAAQSSLNALGLLENNKKSLLFEVLSPYKDILFHTNAMI